MSTLIWDQVPLTGRQVVEASAGTGKTYTITTLLLRLLVERRLRLEQLLVVTFTRAATAELAERVRRRLEGAVAAFGGAPTDDPEVASLVARTPEIEPVRQHLLSCLHEVDAAAILTIHGFCARALAEHAFESGAPFSLEAAADDGALAATLVSDFWAREVATAPAAEVRFLLARAPYARLLALASAAVARPDLRAVPEARPVDTTTALTAYAAVLADVRARWAAERAELLELLRSSPALDRRRMRVDWVPGWAAKVEAFLAGALPSPTATVDGAARFGSDALRAATKAGQSPPEHPFFSAMQALLEAYAAALAALEGWVVGLEQRLIAFARAALPAEKRRLGVTTYDDLLLGLRDALRAPGGERLAAVLRERYPVALIDEFQDTDPVQYEILSRLYDHPGATSYYIGDPKQAIYSFRGADVFAYLEAARSMGGEPQALEVSYRADPRLIAAINRWFSRGESPFLLEAIRQVPLLPRPGARERLHTPGDEHGALELVVVGDALRGDAAASGHGPLLAEAAAAEVARWLGRGATLDGVPLGAADVAVLTRSNREAEQVQTALQRLGLPSVLYGDRSVLSTPEAAELALVLAALAEPGRPARLRAALATPLVGVDGHGLEALRSDEAGWDAWSGRFSRWHERWMARGFAQAFRALLAELEVITRLLAEPRGERRLTNLLHLGELVHSAAMVHHLAPAGLVRWFARARQAPSAPFAGGPEVTQVRLESDADAVRVVTTHRSKGLEYPLVICPSLTASPNAAAARTRPLVFHEPTAEHRACLALDGPGRESALAAAGEEALAEDLRLAYVALTRARHHVTVLTRARLPAATSPLGYALRGGAAAEPRPRRSREAPDRAGELVAALQDFAGDDPAILRVRAAEPAPPGLARLPDATAPGLTLLPVLRRFPLVRRVTSYSGWVAAAPAGHEPEGPDHDEATAEERASRDEARAADHGDEPILLGDFPRGPGPGNALHALLEHVDFPSYDPIAFRPRAQAELARHGLDAERFAEPVARALGAIVATELEAGGPRLRDLRPGAWRSEVEFTLPVRSRRSPAGALLALTPPDVAAVLARYGGPELPPGYPEAVAVLGFPALVGHLRGFVDLVIEHDRRWAVVDYKSNHLGDFVADYRRPALAAAMAEHHYFLQAYLYAVALHRHLGVRRRDYDYDRDFGGVYYLFLRGMSPVTGPRAGTFAFRPPRALVEGLSRLLDGGEP